MIVGVSFSRFLLTFIVSLKAHNYCSVEDVDTVFVSSVNFSADVLVLLPDGVDHEMAACCIGEGVRAYIALQYLGRVSFGETVLVMDAATSFGSLAVQLAHVWGAKVVALVEQCSSKFTC